MNVLRIDNVLLAVGDLDQAQTFYGRALGLTVEVRLPPQAGVVS